MPKRSHELEQVRRSAAFVREFQGDVLRKHELDTNVLYKLRGQRLMYDAASDSVKLFVSLVRVPLQQGHVNNTLELQSEVLFDPRWSEEEAIARVASYLAVPDSQIRSRLIRL